MLLLIHGCACVRMRMNGSPGRTIGPNIAQHVIAEAATNASELASPSTPEFGDCRRHSDLDEGTADTHRAVSLAQQYTTTFGARRAGARVLLESHSDDTQQQQEPEQIESDERFTMHAAAGLEIDGESGGDPLDYHNQTLWNTIHRPGPADLQSGEPVNVAVLDGPVRTDHPDIDNVVYIEPRLRDENGHCGQDDCCPQVAAPVPFWHGTRVAGVIAATRGNGIGAAGVAPVRTLVSVNAGVGGCAGELSLAAALHCAIEYRDPGGRPVRVANISMGSTQRLVTTAMTTAMRRALNENLLVVASAGNRSANIDMIYRWPSSMNAANIITVQSRGYDGQLLKNSNFGFGTVDLGAPAPRRGGLCAASTHVSGTMDCSGDYAEFSQASAAAAVVSGAAALVWSDRRFAGCSAEQMRTLLLTSRSHCLAGRSYRDGKDYEVCLLDLAFLSAKDTAALQAQCSGPARGSDVTRAVVRGPP